jgi:cytochrome c peroxidase
VRWQNRQRDVPSAVHRNLDEDLGRYYRTRDPADIGKFRTPSLRELKYTAPYMHNGAFATLREVVDFFDAGGGQVPNKSPLLRPLNLSAEEKSDLVAFLEALSMEQPLIVAAPALPPILPLVGGVDCAAPEGGLAAKGRP